MLVLPFMAAICRRLFCHPHFLVLTVILGRFNNSVVISVLPFMAAICRAVLPSLSLALMSILGPNSNSVVISVLHIMVAICRAVLWFLSLALTLTASVSNWRTSSVMAFTIALKRSCEE